MNRCLIGAESIFSYRLRTKILIRLLRQQQLRSGQDEQVPHRSRIIFSGFNTKILIPLLRYSNISAVDRMNRCLIGAA
jgi:hypothetical protein